jgi:hypothetical protein
LHDTEVYYDNLTTTKVLVKPELRDIPAFEIYYLQKTGPYAKIGAYCEELKGCFEVLPKNAVFLTIFEEGGYQPHKAKMKIGIAKQDGMRLKPDAPHVASKSIPSYHALTYTHTGTPTLLSLFWIELAKYRRKNAYKLATHLDFVDLELYIHTSLNGTTDANDMEFEMHLPICVK